MGRPNRTEWDEIEILVSNIEELKELIAYNNYILREVDYYVQRLNKRDVKKGDNITDSGNNAAKRLRLLSSCDGNKEPTT